MINVINEGDEVPDKVKAAFDEQDRTLPEGVVAQILIRNMGTEEDGEHSTTTLAALVTTNIHNNQEAAAVLLAIDGAANEFRSKLTEKLARLVMSGPSGAAEAMDIIEGIVEGHKQMEGRGSGNSNRN